MAVTVLVGGAGQVPPKRLKDRDLSGDLYAASTHAHFALESKLELAGLSHDHPAVKRLLPEAQAAAERRTV